MALQKITPCLWFDSEAEEAARHYCSIFPNSRLLAVSHYGESGYEIHGRPAGSAVSLQVNCATQEELDHYWNRLAAGGDPTAQQCGWLKDKYGLSWQVVPTALAAMMADPDGARSDRVMAALLQMRKLDIATLQRAYAG
jgi:predicted 3-demethylubiquinone-9 3-methyltransferase (glyoxalase superfamily)